MGSFFSSLFSWFSSSKYSIIIVGMDSAGKTTLYGLLTEDKLTQPLPTLHTNRSDTHINTQKISLMDIGGSQIQRRTWRNFLEGQPDLGVVYMIDAADTQRYEETLRIFADTVQFIDENVPICVLVNKMDRRDAMNFEQLVQALQRQSSAYVSDPSRVRYFATSLVQGTGYKEGFEWLLETLKQRG